MVCLKKCTTLFIIILIVLPFSVFAGTNIDLRNGIKLFDAEKYGEANKVFTDITDKESDNPVAWYYLGRLYFMDNDFDRAIE